MLGCSTAAELCSIHEKEIEFTHDTRGAGERWDDNGVFAVWHNFRVYRVCGFRGLRVKVHPGFRCTPPQVPMLLA